MDKIKETWHYLSWGALIFFILYIPFGVFANMGYGIGFNPTESEPLGFYYTTPTKNKNFKIGDMVAFRLPKNNIAHKDEVVDQYTYLIKKIGALSGQYLFTRNKEIFVCNHGSYSNSCKSLGICLHASVHGHELACQNWQGYKLNKNQLYMSSQRVKDSYDSRYFGLINKSDVKRSAHYLG